MSVKIKTMVGSLAKTAVGTVKKRKFLADKASQEARRKLCFTCEEFNTERGRCEKCGCNVIAKTAAAGASCPLGKW